MGLLAWLPSGGRTADARPAATPSARTERRRRAGAGADRRPPPARRPRELAGGPSTARVRRAPRATRPPPQVLGERARHRRVGGPVERAIRRDRALREGELPGRQLEQLRRRRAHRGGGAEGQGQGQGQGQSEGEGLGWRHKNLAAAVAGRVKLG